MHDTYSRAAVRALSVAALAAALPLASFAQVSAHSYDRPFSRSTSPWNVPVGSGAVLTPANFGTLGAIRADYEYVSRSSVLDPEVSIWRPDNTSITYFKLRLPPGFSTLTPGSGFTPNNGTNFLNTDGKQLISTNYIYYKTSDAKWVGWYTAPTSGSSIFGQGVSGFGSAHAGSGLPVIGGSLRPGELTGNPTAPDTIRHALNLEVDWAVMYGSGNSTTTKTWPASQLDSQWPNYYGSNAAVKMGALLVVDKNVTAASLGIVSDPGKKLLWTMQNYGGYLVDTSGAGYSTNGGFTMNIGVNATAYSEFSATYGYAFNNYGRTNDWGRDMDKIYRALKIVTNNDDTAIGGGGTQPTGVSPKPLNLVTNPDFDQDQAGTLAIATWTSYGDATADYTNNSVAAHSGDFYLSHRDAAVPINIVTLQDFTGLAAGTYRASVWVQSGGNHTDAQLYVRAKQADGTTIIVDSVPVPAGVIGTWTKLTTQPFTVGYGEAGIRLKTVTAAGNYVRWDDAEFYKE